MRGTTNKYMLPVNFSKAKLACNHFDTMYYSNVLTFLKTYLHLIPFSYKVDVKKPTSKIFTSKLQKVTQVLLVMFDSNKVLSKFGKEVLKIQKFY